MRPAISELRTASLSQGSWELLCTRVAIRLLPSEALLFEKALQLCYTTEEVRDKNYNRNAATHQPVKVFTAEHKGRNAHAAMEEEVNNLLAEICVRIGARVMLKTDLWTEVGLVNGSMCYIDDLLWDLARETNQLLSSDRQFGTD